MPCKDQDGKNLEQNVTFPSHGFYVQGVGKYY